MHEWRPKKPTLEDQEVDSPNPAPQQLAVETVMDQEHNDQTLLSKQQQSREQILEDINKATQLYLSCPDPTEAAARRLKVLAGDARGQVEETVATMLTTNDSIPPGLNQTQQMRVGSQEKTRVHIMEELQQVTLQYLSCADPTEAAARRLRVIASENQGHLEETATGILAENVSSTLNQNTTSHRGIETQREQTLPPPSESNLPVASQNDQIHQLSDQGEESEAELPPRRRRVVPARYRKTASPNPLQGASSRKRSISGMRPSPARKNKDKQSNGSNRRVNDGTSQSRQNPLIQLIPDSTNNKKDFRDAPHRAP